jgi:hypothetical protein
MYYESAKIIIICVVELIKTFFYEVRLKTNVFISRMYRIILRFYTGVCDRSVKVSKEHENRICCAMRSCNTTPFLSNFNYRNFEFLGEIANNI